MIHCREEILPANNTLDTSLATPEANIHVIREIKNQKSQIKKKQLWKRTKKAKANKCALTVEIQANN